MDPILDEQESVESLVKVRKESKLINQC
jgi:hypothetical protein